MKTEHNPNHERTIVDRPLITVNKDDNTKFDLSGYQIRVIDRTDPLKPRIWTEEIEKQVGISLPPQPDIVQS
ncbi:MAG: hypothetical protein KAS32_21410 [Candidatus Peribacteraceae bacterium]|nr:hypothetical protein [Candidatus Peribacteraceae bacterium]